MFIIPGRIISLLTFPGVIVHELAHQLFCRLLGVAIFDVRYFQMDNPSGYVIHEIPKRVSKTVIIAIGPFIVNTVLGALIACPASIPVMKFSSQLTGLELLVDYFLIWLGISIAMHSFPSTGDAEGIRKEVWKKETPILYKIVATPIIGLIYIGAYGSVIWLDLVYGAAIAMLIPRIILLALV